MTNGALLMTVATSVRAHQLHGQSALRHTAPAAFYETAQQQSRKDREVHERPERVLLHRPQVMRRGRDRHDVRELVQLLPPGTTQLLRDRAE